jgi:hypothetical protein
VPVRQALLLCSLPDWLVHRLVSCPVGQLSAQLFVSAEWARPDCAISPLDWNRIRTRCGSGASLLHVNGDFIQRVCTRPASFGNISTGFGSPRTLLI